MSMNGSNMNYEIIPPHLAVKAMRDNGYKNAAYAVAELIDNAIQADATQVELLCADKTSVLNQRRTTRIHQIAVLDNGSGMSSDVLRTALQFGNGTNLDEEKHIGIGRFGMGLPSSSISQCRRVDVWSWQNGIHSALYTYLDLDEVISGGVREVPEPTFAVLPAIWRQVGEEYGSSGTLVVWSNIDRCLWRRSETLIKNSEFLIGRIYRRFLSERRADIRLVSFNIDDPQNIDETLARPNDPLYLIPDTSCPPDLPHIQEGEPMFTEWGEPNRFDIAFRGREHRVTVSYSVAKSEARTGQSAGGRKHGKHAAKNTGVSIIRADRELDLDPGWTDPSDPTDRWWGVEIDFPPALDDFFGVTNNKQSARYFSDLAKINVEDMIDDDESVSSAEQDFEAADDPQWALFEIAMTIQKQIRTIRRLVTHQRRKSENGNTRNLAANSPEAIATEVTQSRQQEGYKGRSDTQQEKMSAEERAADLTIGFLDLGVAETREEAKELAAKTIDRELKYDFEIVNLSSTPGFFDVQSRGGEIIIALNTAHPAYDNLIEVLDADLNAATEDELRYRLRRASDGLRLLLIAWARYEDEQPDGRRLDGARQARWDWGRMAREFLDVEG